VRTACAGLTTSARGYEVELDLALARRPFLALRGLWFVTRLHAHLREIDRFGVNVANNLPPGLAVTEQARPRIREVFATVFADFDALSSIACPSQS
jgi:hypothetical protein